jgi:hypothetical protein
MGMALYRSRVRSNEVLYPHILSVLLAAIVSGVGPHVHPEIVADINFSTHLLDRVEVHAMADNMLLETPSIPADALSHASRKAKQLRVTAWNPAHDNLLSTMLARKVVHVLIHESTVDVIHAAHERVRPIVRHRGDRLVLHDAYEVWV